MTNKQHRSVFWVVSTHVLTTGFAMPAVAGVLGFAIIVATQPSTVAAFLMLLAFQALGYIGGVYYSLSYIRKAALIENPIRCIKPSIVTFVVLAVLGFAVNIGSLLREPSGEGNPILAIAGLVVFYLVISFAFAKITQKGFATMEAVHPSDGTAT